MNTARLLLVEGGLRTLWVTLDDPMSIGAIIGLFTVNGTRPAMITMCNGTARVVLKWGELT